MWENTTPSPELPRDFCAGIGPLQLGVVLVIIQINANSNVLVLVLMLKSLKRIFKRRKTYHRWDKALLAWTHFPWHHQHIPFHICFQGCISCFWWPFHCRMSLSWSTETSFPIGSQLKVDNVYIYLLSISGIETRGQPFAFCGSTMTFHVEN